MKIFHYLLIITLFAGCSPAKPGSSGKKKILVTILPEKSFIEKIAGNDFDVTVLVPQGANPTTYSLLPSQMVDISKSSLWFRMVYVGFELSSADRIMAIQPAIKVIDLSSGLDIISRKSIQHPDMTTGHDPHIWLSPENVEKMAVQIMDELILINPAKKEAYTAGYRIFLEEIKAVDDSIRTLLKDSMGKTFIAFHPSLSYFARDYGLIQYSLEEGGKEPSPAHMAMLAGMAREKGIRTIYIQSEFDQELARTFAGEIGGNIVRIWPLNPSWSENLLSIARELSVNP